MLKILRKYNKLIIVFGGVLLMVVFVLPQLPQMVGASPMSQTHAIIDGEAYTGADYDNARQEYAIIRGVFRTQPLGFIEDVDHYMMLAYEAEKYGLIGGPDDARTLPAVLTPIYVNAIFQNAMRAGDFQTVMEIQGNPEEFRASVRSSLEELVDLAYNNQATAGAQRVDRALATLRGIMRLNSVYGNLAFNSKPEATDAARELFDQALADVAIVGTGEVFPNDPDITGEQLEAFFERYKNVPEGSGDFGFGYLRPDAARVEYLVVSRQGVRQRVDADPLDVRTFYEGLPQQQKDAFGPFAQSRDAVTNAYIDERADALMSSVRAVVRGKLLNARQRTLETRATGSSYYQVTDSWPDERPTLDEIAQAIREDLPASPEDIESPIDVVQTYPDNGEYIDIARAAGPQGPPVLRGASAELGNAGRVPVPDVLRLAIEFDREDEPARFDVQRRQLAVQEGLFIDRPLETVNGDMVFLRITDARPTSPPPSWREVESQVRLDLATANAYEQLTEDIELLREAFAATQSRDEFAAIESRLETWVEGAVISSQRVLDGPNGSVAPDINHEPLRGAVMDLVHDWSPTLDPTTLLATERTIAVGLPSQAAIGLARVEAWWPVSLTDFEESTGAIVRRLNQMGNEAGSGRFALSKEATAERLGYELVGGEDE